MVATTQEGDSVRPHHDILTNEFASGYLNDANFTRKFTEIRG